MLIFMDIETPPRDEKNTSEIRREVMIFQGDDGGDAGDASRRIVPGAV
jgi:hypothetical protein